MADYPIPPWLRPADTAAEYSRGLALGVQIQHQNAAMAQEAQQTQMQLELKKQQLAQDATLANQKIELERAMHQEQMALRKAELDQAAQKIAIATKQAADSYAAQRELQSRVRAGEDQEKVMLELYPRLFKSGSGLGGVLNAMRTRTQLSGPVQAQPVLDPFTKQPMPGVFSVPNERGGMSLRNTPGYQAPGAVHRDDQLRVAMWRQEIARLNKKWSDPIVTKAVTKDPSMQKEYKADMDTVQKLTGQVKSILNNTQATPSAAGAGAKARLRWNPQKGEFEPAQAAAPPPELIPAGGSSDSDEEESLYD